MKIGEKVKHKLRPEWGIGELVKIYSDGECKVIFKNCSIDATPISLIVSAEEEFLDEERQRKIIEEERLREKREEIAREEIKIKQQKELQRIYNLFDGNYLSAITLLNSNALIPENEKGKIIIKYIKNWLKRESGDKLDDQQCLAVGEVGCDAQVIARAGSGKTTTIVNRALFLVKHCKIPAESLLILAFNRQAARDVRKRILISLMPDSASLFDDHPCGTTARNSAKKSDLELEDKRIDKISRENGLHLPHVMTFHALAHAIVHPGEDLLYDSEDGESQKLRRAVQNIVDEHLRNPETHGQVRKLMLAHFRSDWERIVNGGYDKSREELLVFRRSLPRESLNGDFVKSFGEKLIANFLFEHGIPYKYEKIHRWDGKTYRPDFTIYLKGKNLVIEYFGLQGDPEYDRMIDEKRNHWSKQSQYTFLEFSRTNITHAGGGADGFCERLKDALEQQGVSCTRLSEDAIWEKIKDRRIDRFTKAMVNFIGRCRKQNISPGALRELIRGHASVDRVESLFLKLADGIYSDYLDRLESAGEDDFDGLMLRASAAIAAGQTRFSRKSGSGDIKRLSHVLVDEFQDFSKLFFNLIQAIRNQNPAIRIFCVGDDWQAINGFAGSDLYYFRESKNLLGMHRHIYMTTNYRSCRSIVKIGNALMHGEGEPARANKQDLGQVLLCHIDEFSPSPQEKVKHKGDLLTPAILRILDKSLRQNGRIVLLSRTNTISRNTSYAEVKSAQGGMDSYLFYLRSLLPKELHSRVSISTVHKYKGLERDTVILLDVVSRGYPLIHPDSIFTRILGDSLAKLVQEERRLLYVAMTRAIHSLYIFTSRQEPSPFLDDLATRFQLSEIDWRQFPPMVMNQDSWLITVGNQGNKGINPTTSIRDELKASGYTWCAQKKCWIRGASAKNFSIDALESEAWARVGDGLEVRILDGQEACLACYHVNGGCWTKMTGGDPFPPKTSSIPQKLDYSN